MSIELKIKSKSLAAEAKIIRDEENKISKAIRRQMAYQAKTGVLDPQPEKWRVRSLNSIHLHRTLNVRHEARSTLLARAFLAGQRYRDVEQNVKCWFTLRVIIVPKVLVMVNKYRSIRPELGEREPNWPWQRKSAEFHYTEQDILDWIKGD